MRREDVVRRGGSCCCPRAVGAAPSIRAVASPIAQLLENKTRMLASHSASTVIVARGRGVRAAYRHWGVAINPMTHEPRRRSNGPRKGPLRSAWTAGNGEGEGRPRAVIVRRCPNAAVMAVDDRAADG